MGGGGGMGGGVMGLDGDEVASEDVADFLHQVYRWVGVFWLGVGGGDGMVKCNQSQSEI